VHLVSATGTPIGSVLGTLTAVKNTDTTGSGTGGQLTWTYAVADSAVEYLAAGQTKVESFTITLDDQHGGLISRQIDITITGSNDVPVITAQDLIGAVTEQVTPAGNLTNSGVITFTDVDLNDVHLVSATGTPIGSVLGTLTAVKNTDTTGSGTGGQLTWTYAVADSAVEYLAADQTKVESFTITLDDQHGGLISRQIDVTIHGTNDAATITGDFRGSVAEDSTLTTGGKLTITDIDTGENHFQTVAAASLSGIYGTFTFNSNTGVWGYTLNNEAAETLPTGQVVHDTLTVKSADGSASQVIDISITSTNDAPIVNGGVGAHQPNIANDKGLLVFDGHFFFGDETLTVKDPDGPNVGIAIVGLDNAGGFWQYQLADSLDKTKWLPIPEVPEGQAFVLSANDKVRFIGPGNKAAEVLTFKAWDGSDFAIVGKLTPMPAVGGSTAFSEGTYIVGAKNFGPAGIAGEPINLGLADPSLVGQTVSVTISDLASDWTISGGTHNADGSWTVQTSDLSSLSVTTSSSFTGAMLVTVTEAVVQADGTTTTFTLGDNIEAYSQGSPIFAWSGDDFLTASSGKDLLVFSQSIGHDTVYSFDAAADQIDLIGYADFKSFADVQAHMSEDAAGSAVIAVGTGQSITLQGVDEATLTENNFVFDQTATLENAGKMTIGDGAILPLSGNIHNSGVIELNSTGDETDLQLIENGVTLDGGGQILLSDSDANVISGTSSTVTLNNEDNTISGAGQLGNGELSLTNAGTIDATGVHLLTINTGSNIVFNSGTLEASGAGGLMVASSIANSGVLWANASYLTVQGEVSGSGVAKIDGAGTIDFEASSTANVVFGSGAAGTLKLGDAFHFNGTISGFTGSDTIDLTDLSSATASLSYSENAAGGGGTLTISDGSHSLELSLVGAYSADNFSLVSDQAKGTLVSYVPHDLIV